MNYRELYLYGIQKLKDGEVPDADYDARLLLEKVCGTDRNTLILHPDREITEKEQQDYEAFLTRRAGREPLQHILGDTEFMGLSFLVDERVLCPRQDTEVLVEEVLRHLMDGSRILDICTGSGCILLSLLHFSNDCEGVGVDLSEDALEVAKANAERLGIDVTFLHSDLCEKVEGQFDMVVSNPPYIASDVIPGLMPEVRDHEPMMALDGGVSGLDFYERIIPQAREHLRPGGMLFFEIGADQGEAVKALMEAQKFAEVEVIKDYAGLDRVVKGYFMR